MKRFFAAILLALSFVTVSLAQDSANLFRPTATPPSPPCPYSRLFMNTSNQMALVSCTGVVTVIGSGGGGSGTVTSVALALPSIFSVSGSPVTASGTLTATLATQTANTGLMGPTSGGAAAPTFRALVSADIPSLDAAKITSGIIATARLGSGTANSTTFLRGDQTWAVPSFTVTGVPDAINAVRDFGCVGDDVADDTTCLTNALAATALTTGKALYLRTGTYKTTAKLAVPGGVTLYGDGREKTIIHGTANDTILELKAGTGLFLFEGPTIRNLSVYGSSSGANQIGVSVDDAVGPDFYINGAWIENISVYQTGSHGVYFGRAFSSNFKRIYASAPVSGYPFLFDQFNMPGNTFEGLYAQDVNATNPAGFRVRTGDIHCWGCNGINNSSSNSWWAIIGDKVGVDGAASNISAYFNCWGCNIESSKAGGIWHYSDSTSYLDGRTLFSGDASGSGTYVALKYEVTTPGSGGLPAAQPKGKLGPLVVFANSPLSFYANSEVIHANDLPPVTVEGDIRQADGAIISSYRNTTNSRSEKIFRLDARMPVTTITASANFTQPAATNYEANCASGCTLTLPFAGYWASMEQLVYIRNIGIGTLVVNGNSGSSINGGGSYSLASGESVTFIPHSASADYRLVGVGGSGVANRITYWNDVQRVTSSANLTYDGTTVLNQRAGGNPYFAANDTTNGITTRFGPLAGAPDRAIIGTTSNHPFGLYANNAERWTVGVAGHFTPGAANTTDVGSTSLPARSGYFGTSVVLGIGSSVTGQTVFNNSTNSNTTTLKSGAPASSIEITLPATLPASAGCLQISSSGVITQTGSACGSGGGGSTAWSAITDPSAGLTLSMGGHVTAFNWGNATSTANMFTVADTGGNTGTGYVLSLNTASGSAAKPVRITADGVVNGVEMTTAGSLQAMGTGGIVATIGDSATSFFTAGQIEAARGGTGIDSSGSTGVVRVNAGTWSANAGVSHLASSSSADLRGVLNDETGTGAAVFAGGNIGAATATTLNGLTISATTGTLTVANGKTLTFNNTVALSGTDGTTMTFPATTTTVAGLGIAQTFTALQTINPGTTPTTAALIDINSLGTAGTRDSNWLVFRGRSNDGSTHLSEWKQYVDVTANAGTSQLVFESRIDAAAFGARVTIGDDGAVAGGAFSGDSFTASGGSVLDNDVNAATGFTVAGTAASGQYLRGNGTQAVFSALLASDLSGTLPATNFPALTGDVTTTSGNLATTIANDAVTFAKFQNITDNRLLGRSAGSTGDMQEISIGSGLSLSGGTLSATGGGGTPGGSNTQIQYNNAGAFGGISGLTSDGTNMTAGSGNLRATSPQITTGLSDANGNRILGITATTSATEFITIANNTATNAVSLTASSPTVAASAQAGTPLNVTASPAIAGNTNAGAAAGGSVTITAGAAARLTSGNANGGNVVLIGGSGIGTGTTGIVAIGGATSSFPGLNYFTNSFSVPGLGIIKANTTADNQSLHVGAIGVSQTATSDTSNTIALVAASGNITVGSGGSFSISSSANSALSGLNGGDTILRRRAAANWNFGAADAASPVAQTLSVQSVVGGTSNTAGANWTFAGSRSTGSAAGGSLIFQTSPLGSAGTSQNALVTALTIPAAGGLVVPELSSAPSTPSANNVHIYALDSGGVSTLYYKKDNGTQIEIGNSAGGNVSTTGGTSGRLAKFTTGTNIENALLTESGNDLSATATLTLTNAATSTALIVGKSITSQTANMLSLFSTTDANPRVAVDSSFRLQFGPGGATSVDTNLYRQAANTLRTDGAFNVGSSAQFSVNSSGNIVAIRGVTTSFPSANASGVLTNDGAGNLTWASAAGAFTSSAGIIDFTTSTDRLRLVAGSTSTTPLEVDGVPSQTADLIQFKATSGAANPIVSISAAGRLQFGAGGGSAVDVNLYRSGADALKTDDSFDALTMTMAGIAVLSANNTVSVSGKTLTSGNTIGDVTMNLSGTDATGDEYSRNSSGVLIRRPAYNVRAFGAVCDGSTTNDRAAIQAAIDAAGSNGVVSFEGCAQTRIDTGLTIGNGSGTYSTGSGTVSTINYVQIEGGNVQINWYGSAGGTVFTVNGPITGVRIRDMKINMKPSTNAAGIALDLNHPRLSEFSGIEIENNSDYGVRLRAYGNWTGGDGANSNIFDNVVIASLQTGAKGFDIGHTDVCTSCTLDPAQNVFRNIRARFDTGVNTYVSGSIGLRLNFTDASQFDQVIFAASTAVQVNVPTGTNGAGYPAGLQFNNAALTGTTSFSVNGSWAAVERLYFANYLTGDGQTIPSSVYTYGSTSQGQRWGYSADAGYINGFVPQWVSSSQVRVTAGTAHIESSNRLVSSSSSITSSTLTRSTTLSAAVTTTSQTTITVTDGSWMPSSVLIKIGSEQMSCTRSSNTLTCTRNVNGTTATTHSNGATVNAAFWYHLYIYESAISPSTITLDVSTTAPAAAYSNTARSKTSDNTRRYVGSVRCDLSGNISNFTVEGLGNPQEYRYKVDATADNRVLANANASSNTTVDTNATTSVYTPPLASSILVTVYNLATVGAAYFDTNDSGSGGSGLNPAGGTGVYAINPASNGSVSLPLNSTQQFRYAYALGAPTGSNFLYLDLLGFKGGR